MYSAAEYFELAYNNRKQKQMYAYNFAPFLLFNWRSRNEFLLPLNSFRMMDSLKDYTVEALVSTVDHLGSVSYKANDLLNERVEEVSGTELRVSCVEQVLLVLENTI